MINEKMRELGARRSSIRELFEYGKRRKAEIGEDCVFDFSLGNPSVPSPDGVGRELIRLLSEEDSIRLHGYTSAQGDGEARAAIAEDLERRYGAEVDPDLIYMTCGAAAALTIALGALVCRGEEVIVNAPYFPEYKVFAEAAGGVLRVVNTTERLMPDVEALAAAINERTAAVILNSPNNPSGAVVDEECLTALAELLRKKSAEYAHPIYLISDEPYRELVYGDAVVPFVSNYYEETIVCYSFSKSLSLPGERIGYVMVSPSVTDCREVYHAIAGAGRSLGFVCAPSLLQKAIPALLSQRVDTSVYDKNRQLLYGALTEYGFEAIRPDGAFYLFVKTPEPDSRAFCDRARDYELLIVPGDDFGSPGYARISYCVATEVIERSLPAFRALAESCGIYK